MALSNILREPRREITETLVGVSTLIIPVGISYPIALYFPWDKTDPTSLIGRMAASILLEVVAAAVLVLGTLGITLLAIGLHTLGEIVCNELQFLGVHLRPRQRRIP